MKKLLTISVLINLTLIAAILILYSSTNQRPAVIQPKSPIGAGSLVKTNNAMVVAANPSVTWTNIYSTNFDEYITNLRWIGCPKHTISHIIGREIDRIYGEKLCALQQRAGQTNRYWRVTRLVTPQERSFVLDRNALDREKLQLLHRLLGSDVIDIPIEPKGYKADLTFLAADKQAQLRALQSRYRQLESETYVRLWDGNIDPNQSVEWQQVFERETAEMKQLLTADEYQEYQLRNSMLASLVALNFACVHPSEEEFRQIYKIKESHQSTTPADIAAADKEIAVVLGLERFNVYKLQQDADYKQLLHLSQRFGFPSSVAAEVVEIRTNTQERAAAIRNGSEPWNTRRAALKNLRDETERLVSEKLGEPAYSNYKTRFGLWINRLAL